MLETPPIDRLGEIENLAALIRSVAALHKHGATTNKLAEALNNCHPDHIRHLLRLDRNLEESIFDFLSNGQLKLGHARALASWPKTEQPAIAAECIAKRWSVRTIENKRRNRLNLSPLITPDEYKHLAMTTSEHIGFPCEFQIDPKDTRRGKLAITFSSYEELDNVLDRLGAKEIEFDDF